ncbi:MAG TPA: hypothetical protein VG145_06470 [Xanthobacteraceae bacterium]|jgi:hypothetical protein|nr:hypothetical protein [Xanthobacteraceae bacterium]
MVRNAAAAIVVVVLACMAWSSGAFADCSAGVVPERLSCLNAQVEALRTQSAKEVAGLKAEIQMLRNQLVTLEQTVGALPPTSSIARLDEDVNLLWEPQDGCLAWTGPEGTPAPEGGGLMRVFAPCAKAGSQNSVKWRLQRAPLPR